MVGDQDEDRFAVVQGLRAAVGDSGLSQARFARAISTSASRFSTYLSGRMMPSAALYLRAKRLGRALRTARENSWLTPLTVVTEVPRALTAADPTWALRLTLQTRDHLRRALDEGVAGDAWRVDPGSTGDRGWDSLLAGLIGHEFEIRQLPAPAWTRPSGSDEQRLFESPFFTADEVRAETPDWLRKRGLFILARDLVTA